MQRSLSFLGMLLGLATLSLTPDLPVLSLTAALAQGDAPAPSERAAAIDKGIAYLRKAQQADGSWDYDEGPFPIGIHMKQGCTALVALALLKSGVTPDDPAIKKGFDFIAACPIEHIYSAGCVLLALEARYNWEPPREDESEAAPGEGTREKPGGNKPAAKKQKPTGRDVDLAQRCMEFLVKNQAPSGTWSYPRLGGGGMGRDGDLSNAQYALLGLDAAERLGLAVPKEPYEKAQDWLQGRQEQDGPEIPSFAVPGADLSWKELRKIEKEMRDKLKQIDKEFAGKGANDTNAAGHTEADERRTTTEEAAKKILTTTTARAKMHARGFIYYGDPPGKDGAGTGDDEGGGRRGRGHRQLPTTASMTTAGTACLLICKAHLDGTKLYEKTLKGPMDRAIRDGAAWIAKNFSVTENTGASGGGMGRRMPGHLYYYLYGLERAGVLLLVPRFGEHDWYAEGCKGLVRSQGKDGSWNGGDDAGTIGPVCDTCFALLFLARGTTPLVRIPTRTATGGGDDATKK